MEGLALWQDYSHSLRLIVGFAPRDFSLPWFVDLLLTRGLRNKNTPRWKQRRALIFIVILVAGTGFEPVTFRL